MSDRTVIACPECDSPVVDVLNPKAINGDGGTPYRCCDCGAEFDDPTRRPPHHESDSRSGLAKRLVEIGQADD
jgi:DNA-directed RNA polymerase subunit RPC12/RpoP